LPFARSIDDQEIARQIAEMLNIHNHLASEKSARDLLKAETVYVIETHGKIVIGACGIHRQGYSMSEVKHLVVRPQWRGKGLGKFLVSKAVARSKTPSIYATIRSDNTSSMRLFNSVGFTESGTYEHDDHHVRLLVKVLREWKPKKVSLYA
jgi:L-amino acid N-acyltransferase YncA